jgi:sulfur carrier protein ThiS
MKIHAKIFGILRQRFSDYSPDQGLELEVQEGTTAGDLLAYLEISDHQEGVVIMKGRALKREDKLTDGDWVNIFHTMYGG